MKLIDLLEEFNVVINTTEGLTELRSLILGLAVRGKLVPQDPNDEPASELLKKIEAKKEQLYEEGEIRKPKKLKKVTKDQEPFNIPKTWTWAKLGHLFNIYTGDSISKRVKEEKYVGVEGQTYLGTKDVNYGFQSINYKTNVSIPLNELDNFNTAPKDSVLVCAEGGSAGKKCGYVEEDVCFGNKLICNVPFFKTNTKLLLGYMLSDLFRSQFVESMTGIIGGISQTNYNELLFPLPPLEEQDRIVNKFEELLEEVRELEDKLNRQAKLDEKLQLAVNAEVQQAPDVEASKSAWNFITSNFDTLYHTPESIENLKKNILNEAVHGRLVPQKPNDEPASELLKKIEAEKQRLYDKREIRKPKKLPPVKEDEIPFEIPESWKWVRLSEINDAERQITYGIVKMGAEPTYSGVYALRCSDIKYRDYDLSGVRKVTKEVSEKYSRTVLEGGEILLNIRGTLGGCVITNSNFAGYNIAREIGLIVLQDKSLNEFVFNVLTSPYFTYQVNKNLRGIAYKGLNLTILNELLIPIPPLEEQHRIGQRIEELFAICDRFKAQLKQLEKVNEKLVKGLVKEVLEWDNRIRKTEPIARVLPFKSTRKIKSKVYTIPNIHKTDLQVAVSTRILILHEKQKGRKHHLGRTTLEKTNHVIESHIGCDLGRKPYRMARGAADFERMVNKVEPRAKKLGWFNTKVIGNKVYYTKGPRCFDAFQKINNLLTDEEIKEIDRIINLFLPLSTKKAEIYETVYAAWHDLIAWGYDPTEYDIVIHASAKEFWHEEKESISKEKFYNAINWLKENDLVPDGKGKLTKH